MPKTYQNDQKIRRSFILYEFKKKKPIFDSFKNLCETMGNNFMKYPEFQFWFQRFSSGNFDLDYDTSKMSDALRKNPIALRSCILYDFLLEKSTGESYESLCSVVGSDALPREEFDFWLNRFGNGNFALEFEFSDLPTDVLKVIIEKSELEEQLLLRKVSSPLRSLVDQVRPNISTLEIYSDFDHISLCFDSTQITYAGPDFEKRPAKIGKPRRYYVIDEDYLKMYLKDLHISLKNRALKLELLKMDFDDTIQNGSKFYGDVGRLLESIDHRCHLKSLHMSITNQDDVLSILSCFIPGVLNRIILFSDSDQSFPLLQIDKLTKTEQWKHAEFIPFYNFKIQEPMDSFHHLRHFRAEWNQVTPEELKGLRDTLLKTTNLKYCEILTDDDIVGVEEIMGTEENNDDTLIYQITNSANYLKTGFDGHGVFIEKKSKD